MSRKVLLILRRNLQQLPLVSSTDLQIGVLQYIIILLRYPPPSKKHIFIYIHTFILTHTPTSFTISTLLCCRFVEDSDVAEAIRLMRVATQNAATDPRTGTIDMDMIATGQGASDRWVYVEGGYICFRLYTNFRSFDKSDCITSHDQHKEAIWRGETGNLAEKQYDSHY